MEWIKGAGFLLSFLGYLYIGLQKQKKETFFVPISVIAALGLVLYAGALLGFLKTTASILYVGGLGCFGWQMIHGKVCLPKWNTFRVCFFAGTIVFGSLILSMRLLHYDNFSHWALIVKYLLSVDALPEADSVLVSFRDYPPGCSLFIYYVCRFLGRSQSVMLLAQNSILFSCFLAVFGIVREKRRFLCYSFLGMGCCMLSYLNLTIRINNLLVDFLLPLLSMAAMAAVWRFGEQCMRASVTVGLILGFTVIVKDTGILFALVPLLFYLSVYWKKEKRSVKTVTASSLTAAFSLLPFFLWQLHVNERLAGVNRKFGASFGQQTTGAVPKKLYGQVIQEFVEEAFDLSDRAFQVFILCNLAAVIAVILVKTLLKKKWKLGKALIFADILVLIYYLGILWLYLYAMPEEEALRLAGFERYACSIMTLFAGILLLCAEQDLENSFSVGIDERGPYRAFSSPETKRYYQYGVLATLLIGINFLYSEWNGLVFIRESYTTSLPGIMESVTGDRWYEGSQGDTGTYLIAASDESGKVSDWSVQYVGRYFLYSDNVDVTEQIDSGNIEQIVDAYDCIIVLDRETVQLGRKDPGYEILQEPGMYPTKSIASDFMP